MKRNFLISIFTVFSSCLFAEIKLPALVGDNMVLQRDAKITLWGWADASEKVSIQFQNFDLNTTTDKDGRWTIILPAIPAGGPFEMVINGKSNKITIKNILVGDVWLASGQSNMDLIMKIINNAKKEIETANYPQIRLFAVQMDKSLQPLKDVSSYKGWQECSPNVAENFSAVAYLFGRELFQKYHVPIGLISSTVGGTIAELWMSAEALKPFPDYSEMLAAMAKLDYADYRKNKDAWYREFGSIDRGQLPNQRSWADEETNTADWPTMKLPGFWMFQGDLKAFSGVVWFRKEIILPKEAIATPLELHLSNIIDGDSVFLNGHFIGASFGMYNQRIYHVPANIAREGKNLIALRIKGMPAIGGGVIDVPGGIFIQAEKNQISLSGDWLYKTGPDIQSLPFIAEMEGIKPTGLYNAMIKPLTPYTIKGVIWYQGESNTEGSNAKELAENYHVVFPALINDWRKQWGYDFPFLFVQLAGFSPNEQEPADYPRTTLREAQSKTLSLPQTGMATAIDLGNENDIHPKNKQDVAHRLALVAEKIAYGENVIYSGPTYKSANITGDKIRLNFDHIGSGLFVKDKYGYVRGFAIAGADKKFVWAEAWREGNEIVVSSHAIKNPIYIRYDWENTPDGNLYNIEGLPTAPFRTDE